MSGMNRYASTSAARASASWASRSAWSGSPCAIATRARVVSGSDRNTPVVVDTASSAQRRAATRSPPASAASALRTALHRRRLGQGTHVWPGRLGRVLRRRSIAGGQGRDSQRAVGGARFKPAKLGSGLDGRVGGGPGRRGVTLVRQRDAPAHEAIHPPDLIVSCLGLVGHRGELCYRSGQITLI